MDLKLKLSLGLFPFADEDFSAVLRGRGFLIADIAVTRFLDASLAGQGILTATLNDRTMELSASLNGAATVTADLQVLTLQELEASLNGVGTVMANLNIPAELLLEDGTDKLLLENGDFFLLG